MDLVTGVGARLGGRLRLAFLRPSSESDEVAAPSSPAEPIVEFVAYAEASILSGRLRLTAERLSDLLNEHESFELIDVLVHDLAGGHGVELREMVVERDELLLVHAQGPRGNAGRRQRTRQHPIVIKSGPYEVRGYVHALPGSDPIAGLRHRRPMIALTDAVIEYTVGSVPQQYRASVLIVNRDGVDWITEGSDEPVPSLDMPADSSGPLLKDFTGQLSD